MDDLRTTLTCECGEAFEVGATDAGDLLACLCGRSVTVPTLSKLRSLAGKDAYITNPAETIRKIQRDGRCPAGDRCVVCGSDSPVYYECHAACESPHMKRTDATVPSSIPRVLGKLLVFGPLGLLFARRTGATASDVVGHEVHVSFQLPVCRACESASGEVTRSHVAKRLASRVTEYNELFSYYPELELKVERPDS